MTTQTASASVITKDGRAVVFTGTCTDGAATWKELLDETATNNHLYDTLGGMTIVAIAGKYAAGTGMWRIRNTKTGVIIDMGALDLISTVHIRPLDKPITVQAGMVLEAVTMAVPT